MDEGAPGANLGPQGHRVSKSTWGQKQIMSTAVSFKMS